MYALGIAHFLEARRRLPQDACVVPRLQLGPYPPSLNRGITALLLCPIRCPTWVAPPIEPGAERRRVDAIEVWVREPARVSGLQLSMHRLSRSILNLADLLERVSLVLRLLGCEHLHVGNPLPQMLERAEVR